MYRSYGYIELGGQFFWASCLLTINELIKSYDNSYIQFDAILKLTTAIGLQLHFFSKNSTLLF